MRRLMLFAAILLAFLNVTILEAATLRVIVKDQNNGNLLSGATVCYTMQNGSKTDTQTTGGQGRATFDAVPAGGLQIVATKAGFVGGSLVTTMPAADFQQEIRLLPGVGGVTNCPGAVGAGVIDDLKAELSQDTPNPILTGGLARYTATVKNVGTENESNVKLAVTFPTSSIAAPGCSIAGAVATCTIAQLARGAQQQFHMAADMPQAPGKAVVTAQVDPNNIIHEDSETNNTATAFVAVVAGPDFDVSIGNHGLSASNQLAWTVFVLNNGDGPAQTFVLRATLPKEVDFASVEENTVGTCVRGPNVGQNQVVNCTGASLPAAASRHVRIISNLHTNLAPGIQTLFNLAVDPDNVVVEHNENNNLASAVDTIRTLCDLVVTGAKLTKGFIAHFPGAPPLGLGALNSQELFIAITVKNNGPDFCDSDSANVKITWPGNASSNVCPGDSTFNPKTESCDPVPFNACFNNCTATGLSHISAGNETTVTTSTGFIDASLFGDYHFTITAEVDTNGQIPETNDQNNSSTIDVHIP